MKLLPVLFSQELIDKIKAGHKTCTRRLVNPQPDVNEENLGKATYHEMDDGSFLCNSTKFPTIFDYPVYPRYHEGDTLYVLQAFQIVEMFEDYDKDTY